MSLRFNSDKWITHGPSGANPIFPLHLGPKSSMNLGYICFVMKAPWLGADCGFAGLRVRKHGRFETLSLSRDQDILARVLDRVLYLLGSQHSSSVSPYPKQ